MSRLRSFIFYFCFIFFKHLLASFVTREEGIIQADISVFSPHRTLLIPCRHSQRLICVESTLKLMMMQLVVFRKAGQKFSAQSLVFLPSSVRPDKPNNHKLKRPPIIGHSPPPLFFFLLHTPLFLLCTS